MQLSANLAYLRQLNFAVKQLDVLRVLDRLLAMLAFEVRIFGPALKKVDKRPREI